jgi:hypothetical protein
MSRCLWMGVLLWGCVFAIASVLYPWGIGNRQLFEWFMAVVVAGAALAVATAYVRELQGPVLPQVITAAVLWPVTCVVLDFVVFLAVVPRVSVGQYLKSVGLAYLIIPPIVLGLAYRRPKSGTPKRLA